MSREIGDERRRYRRRSLRDRAMELVDWGRGHRAASVVVFLFLGVALIQVVAPARSAQPVDLRVGDCLYIRTASSMDVGPGARPIGPVANVEAVLMSGGAEQAGCNASHGHEVSAVLAIARDLQAGATQAALRDALQPACAAAFQAYVGKDAVTSSFETFVTVPTDEQLAAGADRAICLVARRDGQWMTSPAHASGE